MHTLIYLSSASHLFSNEELIEILTKARSKNTRLDITGLLLYNDGSIMQVLEGEKEVLDTLYNTISMDDRHKRVIKMIDVPILERSFRDWSMGFKQISNEDWSELKGYFNLTDKKELSRVAGSGSANIIAMIKSFASVNRIDFG